MSLGYNKILLNSAVDFTPTQRQADAIDRWQHRSFMLIIQLMYKFKFPDEKIFFQNKKIQQCSAILSFKVKKGPKNKVFQKKSVKYDSFNDY